MTSLPQTVAKLGCHKLCLHGSTIRSLAILCRITRVPLRLISYSPYQCRHIEQLRPYSTWSSAVSVVHNAFSRDANNGSQSLGVGDPLRMIAKELNFQIKHIRKLVGSGHPALDAVAKYYTQSEGKHVRPTLVLLMSRATSYTAKSVSQERVVTTQETIDSSLSHDNILLDSRLPSVECDMEYNTGDPTILPSQRRLAEITELIHVASLLHDDVIDQSLSRRSGPSANIQFGNKMAVLGGDFLLGRASVALARLRDPQVIELLATVIANLVEGEFMQLKNTARDESDPVWTDDALSYYLHKTYLKSASLISKSCRAAALLGNSAPEVVESAYLYGKNIGLAFQLVDDMLDYTVSGVELGKPSGADLELGLATAPLLFAWKDNPELGILIGRRFSGKSDIERVSNFQAIARTCF